MYKGYQEELFPNPWGVNVGFKHLQEKLDELVPAMGMCEFPRSKNKNLEKFMTFSTMVLVINHNCLKEFSVGLLVQELLAMQTR